MQKIRNGASTVFFLFVSSLIIASAFISFLAKATTLLDMPEFLTYAPILILIILLIPAIIIYIRPLHKKWSTSVIVFCLGIDVILISLLILRMADQAFGETILDLFFGGAKDLSQFSLWAMLGASIVFVLLILFLLGIILFVSRYTIFSPAQFLLLWIFRWLGKIYRFLASGCPAPVIRLADVVIIVWLTEKAYNILIASSSRIVIDGTSQINGAISNVTYLGARYMQGSLLDGPFDGLLLNMDSTKGVILYWNYFGDNFFYAMISSIITTIWFHWEKILVIWFLLEVILFVMKASHQLSIEAEDFTNSLPRQTKTDDNAAKGADKDGPSLSGLADLLATNLNRISELYRDVDEQRAIRSESGAGRPVEATLKSGEIGEILKSSTSEKSAIGLGPISIPMGSVTGMIGRLMQGPRITIGLHQTKDTTKENGDIFYLTATMTGSEPYSWVVDEQPSLDGKRETRTIDDMVDELSHRIFAKLAFGEPGKVVPWKAVWNFNEGLRAYRDCLHSIKKRLYYLKDAEKYFINAAEEEDDSIKAYYNLGVVYTELQQLDSAEVAFSRAIKKNPNGWEAYYALGLNIYNRARDQEELSHSYHDNELLALCKKTIKEQYTKVVDLSDYIIELKEAIFIWKDFQCLAKAYNLKGDAMSHLARIDENKRALICADRTGKDTSVVPKISILENYTLADSLEYCKKSAYYSWLALFEAEFWEDDVSDARKLVSECLIDLAELYLLNQNNYNARKSLEQAISLNPSDSNLHLYLGKAYCLHSDPETAREIFEFGSKMAPEDARFQACLGCVFNKLGYKERAFQICDNIMVYGPDACSAALDVVAKVYESMKMGDQCHRLENASFLARLKDDANKGDSIITCLEMVLECGGIDKGGSGTNTNIVQDWKRAKASATLIKILDDLDSMDNDRDETKNIYEIYIKEIIYNLKCEVKSTNGWEKAQILYSCGYLSYLYYDYRYKSFREARERFDRHRHYLNLGRMDQARKCINNSIKILEINKIKFISDFDKKIENAKRHLENDSISIVLAGAELDALFNELYLDKNRESEAYLTDARNVLKCKLDLYKFINFNLNRDYAIDCNFVGIKLAKGSHRKEAILTIIQEKTIENINTSDEIVKSSNKIAIDELKKASKMCGTVYIQSVNLLEDCGIDRLNIYVDEFINTLSEINDIFKDKNELSNSDISKIKKEISIMYSLYIQEYSQLLIESGQLYLKMKKPKEAEKAFQEAIELLKDERPQDIKSRSLWTLLSRSQSELGNEMSDALKGAQKGRMVNPLGYDERSELGSIFCKLEEFDFGLQELDYAQSWKPDGPDILVEMGRSYLKQANECGDKEHRQKILANACDKLSQALRIYDKSLIIKRGVARYWLGKVYYEMGEYKKAIPHFRILYNVRSAKIDSDRDTLIIALRLAQAYLKAKSFDESERLFDLIIVKRKDLDDYEICDIPGEKYDDPIFFKEIIIKACLGKSISCLERNGNPCIALDNAGLAIKYIDSPEYFSDDPNCKKISSERLCCLNADYDDCIGWIYYNLGLVNEAIDWLEKSVSKQAKPYTYLHLAMAYECKMNLCNPQSKGDSLIARRALKCCQLANELDLRGEYKQDLKELNMRLRERSAEKSPVKNT
ncbi:MAG: tetratricopeptide repeat protein [Methanothrix sp.]